MNEFEFRPDRTTDYGVSCPWASKKYPYRPYNGENGVSTFSLLFLIGSFWYFHVTRTSIKAWMSLNFLKWDLAHWTQVSDRCLLGYLFTSGVNTSDYERVWSLDCRYHGLTEVDRTDSGLVTCDHYSDSLELTKLSTVQLCLWVWLILVPHFRKNSWKFRNQSLSRWFWLAVDLPWW